MIDVPSAPERRLVARCLLDKGILIGNEEEIWTHQSAWRTLGTFRMCMEAIRMLYRGGHGVQASYVKAIVMQEDGLEGVPFALDEVAEFMLEDPECRMYWDGMLGDRHFPHRCPHCGAAAFIGLKEVWCKARCPESKTRD